jgi:CRP-like cAMP-binding protein
MSVSSPDLKAFLLATPFFGALSDPSLDLLISMLIERSFQAGETIVSEGEPGRSMFVLGSGRLAVSRRGRTGDPIHLAHLEPGDFFGEMTLIEMQNRSSASCTRSQREISTHTTRPTSTRML